MISDPQRFKKAIEQFDLANSEDPNKEEFQGKAYPKELLYAQRMSDWLLKLSPDASETLQLAARSQHLRRWEIPRSNYPVDRPGYLKWRSSLKQFHADRASEILTDCNYDSDTIEKVKALILKKNLKKDPDTQLLEDVICLVFLEFYFQNFMHKHDREKIISIVQKTWRKMSGQGHQAALKLELTNESRQVLNDALSS